MNFSLTPDQEAVRDAVQKICGEFDDDYWFERDRSGDFPEEFYRAIADGGWLGIAMPEEHGRAGLDVTEAALMMHPVARSSGAMSAASVIRSNIFGPHPVVVFGTDEHKKRWFSGLIQGKKKSCFGVTEPDAGLNTTSIKTRACGKTLVLNLEPEDLTALTIEAAAMAKVPLAGTDWIPGKNQ